MLSTRLTQHFVRGNQGNQGQYRALMYVSELWLLCIMFATVKSLCPVPCVPSSIAFLEASTPMHVLVDDRTPWMLHACQAWIH